MKVYDITRPLSSRIAVWPGDRPYRSRWTARLERGDSVNLGSFETSTHAGTHVDAPLHYLDDAKSVDQLDLAAFIGPVLVVDVRGEKAVEVRHVAQLDVAAAPRVLFRSAYSDLEDETFNRDFTYVRPETIHQLGAVGVRLVGTDAPSVDPYESTTLPAHHALARWGIINLENLMLRDISAGRYDLVALPMKLEGLEAAPVRAVLLERAKALN